jgi:DNA polymerase IV
MQNERYILHIDMDAFFASVEQMDNPKYAGRPLIVGGNPQGRGVVAACSYEARKFGIHSAMSAANAIRYCPHALFVRPRKERYKEISIQVMHIFRECAAVIEPLSLDEAFLDISDDHANLEEAIQTAEDIRTRVFNEVGLTCSAGVSHNKFLAKVASDINKPDGLTVISQEEADDFLAALPIGKFFGVGKVTEKKMHGLGVRKGADLFRFTRKELERFFGKAGLFFYDIVRGIDNRPVQVSRGCKSIGTETTFHTDLIDMQEINEILHRLSEKVEQSLKRKECGGTTITLKVRYHDFTTVTRSHTLTVPLFSATEIMQLIPNLLQATDAGKTKIRLLGITVSNLSDLTEKHPLQLSLPF